MNHPKRRRLIAALLLLIAAVVFVAANPLSYKPAGETETRSTIVDSADESLAINALGKLDIKDRAPKTGYSRSQFGSGWGQINGCDARNVVLQRDLTDTVLDGCLVMSGSLNDPYTGKVISFKRGAGTSSAVQIDHVVALSDAWQKGAQQLDTNTRKQLANDPLELLAVDGKANQQKGDADAAAWLPPNEAFRCEYAARQITVKRKYLLWVTQAERDALANVLAGCPDQKIISP
jgi:hypothetical protein